MNIELANILYLRPSKFDIAIQVSKNDEAGKGNSFGTGISVVNLNFSKNNAKSSHHETSNRIKFSIDMFIGMEKLKSIPPNKKQ